MANTIAAGTLAYGGAVVETSGGTKYAIFAASNLLLVVYKNIDGVPALGDSASMNNMFNGGTIAWIDAAIDGNDDIHVVAACASDEDRDIAYCVYDCATDEFQDTMLGEWEQAAPYDEGAPTNPGVAISIDSGDIPHILYVDSVRVSGATQDNIYYTNRSGGSWAAPAQVGTRSDKNDAYSNPKLTLCAADDIEAFYYFNTNGDPAYKRKNGAWGAESVYAETAATIGAVTITTGDTVYRYHVSNAQDIEESNVNTGYDSDSVYRRVSAVLVDDSDRYVFYIDTSDDVHLISNDGGGWDDEGALQTGTYLRVIAEWGYNNENQAGEINYIFDNGVNVYYDSFALPAPPGAGRSFVVMIG